MLNYNEYLIFEKYDSRLRRELINMGINDDEIDDYINMAQGGKLGKYLEEHDRVITFGLLKAIFDDCVDAKRRAELKTGVVKYVHRIVPIALAPFFPIIALLGVILGTSRAFNKILKPILEDPGKDYPEFLVKIITNSMKVAEGEIEFNDHFYRAFVISDDFVDILKPEILYSFAVYLSDKMEKEKMNKEVPEHYIENELKSYINDNYNINPEIGTK